MQHANPGGLVLVAAVLVGCVLACSGSHGDRPATPGTPPTQPAANAPGLAVCPDVGLDGQYSQRVRGAHRACQRDEQCASVVLDCSNVRCTGASVEDAASYKDQFDCKGFPGSVGDYDCRARHHAEAPRCEAGCCVSRRL